MPNQNLARGVILAGIALAFGLSALRLPIGQLSHSGAGLFPLIVSSLLLCLALIIIVRSFIDVPAPLYLNYRSIAVIMLGLAGFVIASKLLNMTVGIVWLVFVAALAGTSYSWKRNLKVSVGLIAVALVFQKFLGLSLRLV